MKKLSIYLTISVMAVLAVACSKNGSQVDPTKPEAAKEANIGFGSASAKAPGALEINTEKPMRIRVFDFYTKQGAEEIKYIDDLIQEATTAGAWAFVSENEYAWKKGTHKFFGWVTKDAAGQDVSGLSFNEDTKVLTLSASNTDYQYSTLQTVEWPDATLTDGTVPMTVKHLTAALKLKVTNMMESEQTVAVTSVTLKNVVTTASATVDYSETAEGAEGKAVVTYGEGTTGNLSLPAIASTTLAAAGSVVSDMTYVWPQSVNPIPAEAEPGEEGSEEEGGEDEGSEETPAVVATVDVAYTLGGTAKTTTMTLPAAKWEAGNCYTLDLQIVNKNIVLVFKVQPWDASEQDGEINTSTGSINMSNVTWMNTKVKLTAEGEEVNTVNNSGYAVNMYYQPYVKNGETWTQYTANNGYFPAQGYFTVNYPVAGLFKIGLIPAYGETEVSPEFYEIYIYEYPTKKEVDGVEVEVPGFFRPIDPDGEEISMNTVYFQVRAAGPKDAQGEEGDDDYVPAFDGQDGAEHKAQIDIWFKPDGSSEWISAYSEIRANYALTIPATN